MLSPRDSTQKKRQIKVQSEEMEDDTLIKRQPKENKCSHTHFRQNRLQAKKKNWWGGHYRWTLYKDKRDKPSSRHNIH